MAKNSRIEWTTHTFNPWWGCVKVSPACKHCYAESWAKRVGQPVWGIRADRRFFGEAHWNEPLRWDREAAQSGERARVFCASMADVFEDRGDLDPWRDRLWALIEATPNLDWLLLTKRPQHIASMAPWDDRWPANVWLGTTVEDQDCADERLPLLAAVPAAVRFISAEPLLGPVDLGITAKRTGPRFIFDTNQPVTSGGVIVYPKSTPAYWLVNLDARLNMGYFADDLDKTYLQLNVYNLFDKLYVGGFNSSLDPSSGAPFAQIGAPRTISGTLNVGF